MIVTGYTTSVSDGEHQHITSAIDESGDLYVAWHGSLDGSSRDQVYLIRSTDGGTTWTSPVAMTSGTNGYILPDLMVDHSNKVHLIYADDWDAPPETASRRVYYRSSTDGVTWSDATIPDNGSTGASFSNISIIESKNNNLFIFGQRSKTSNCGLAFSKSTNGGISWSAFALADYPTAVGCAQGYADPSAAIGSDGTIYTVSRNDRYADGSTITCNEYPCWTNVVNMSTDEGVTWSRAETNLINNTRIWTSNSLRYQTWWNYGGQLEWVWHQGVDASNQATYYKSNTSIRIYNGTEPPGLVPTINSPVIILVK
jgi:hypothetical protein